ncbi:MAG: hypothetical protein DYG92_00220 [Leptolyngbya sp. PLA1]|nr:hypothetical protein [Leptolyngbya sp. PLA1]
MNTNLLLPFSALVLLACTGAAFSQTPAMQLRPAVARPATATPATPVQPDPADADEPPSPSTEPGAKADASKPAGDGPTKAQLEQLRKEYDALNPDDRERMLAYYADMGLNLDEALGLAAERGAQATRGQQITMAMQPMDFTRSPAAVLGARARLGFGQVAQPNADVAPPPDVAKWIHTHVLAGEWAVLGRFLSTRPAPEAEAIYGFIVQTLGRGDAGLLPEEILAFAEASPGEFKPWQMETLGKILQKAAAKSGTGAMMARLRDGTTFFGPADAAHRARTVEFLAAAGLVREAYEFLPPLEEARAQGRAEDLLVHSRYKSALAADAGEGLAAESLKREAWELAAQTALVEGAKFETRREALRLGIEGLSTVPRAGTAAWLRQVFASDSLGPVALELMALRAASIGDAKQDVADRAQTILTLKEGIDVLLERENVDTSALRVPLRMLTAALVNEMEQTAQARGQQRVVTREAQLLLRAIPSEKWLSALEPSLAIRARRASIAIATTADEIDQALSLTRAANQALPAEAAGTANHFLECWEKRLNPAPDENEQQFMFYFYYREFLPMAPLTRGRQQRNLDRLAGLMKDMQSLGVDPAKLPGVVLTFKACHAKTEVYQKADIERVLGPLTSLPAPTAMGLARTMAASLNGDWRSRQAQRATGAKRTDTEIAAMVDKGYGLALELADAAMVGEPGEWKHAATRAAIAYDRMQYLQSQGRVTDPAKQNEYRKEAFEAFARAADRYARAISEGLERDDPSIYRRWFGAAMGTAELNFLRVDDLPKEGTLQDDQVDLVRKAITALPQEAADRHLAVFARDIQAAVERAEPEVKPRLVKHALRVIGTHPAGASLRSMDELYQDLVRNELRLRLTIDGDDRVGVDSPFGVLVSLRYTNSVDRETGGFSKYLQNNVWGRVGSQYREINYRDQLQKEIEASLSKSFSVESLGFFDPFMPARGVVEDGQDGWKEKPMAYVILRRKDASVDRLPQLVVDMQFTDQTGPVTLAVQSNTPLLAQGEARERRPVNGLKVSQIVDVRPVETGEGAVTLEVRMVGEGVLPDVRDVLDGLDEPLAGYTLPKDGIEARPALVLQEGSVATGRFGWSNNDPPKEGYPEPDDKGMYRLKVERTFLLSYARGSGAVGRTFALPALRPDHKAELESRAYADLDIVPVSGTTVAVAGGWWTPARATLAALLTLLVAALAWWLWKKKPSLESRDAPWLAPARVTPLGVVTSLRRLRASAPATLAPDRLVELDHEITSLELKYFGPGATDDGGAGLREVIQRWAHSAGPSKR